MSVITSHGTKTLLPRRDSDRFWNCLRAEYAAEDRRRWKSLAMLTLTEAVGWPPDRVALAFGVTSRQVNRGVDATRRSLKTRFRPQPEDSDEDGGATAEGGRTPQA